MDRSTFDAWLKEFGETWTSANASGFAALFTENATYQGNPFRPAVTGRRAIQAYIDRPGPRPKITFTYDILAVTRGMGITQWAATIAREGAASVNIDGILAIRLDAQGLCTSLREWPVRQEAPTA